MGGSACRPHSREKVICQVLTYCHANGFVHKHLVYFFVSSSARGRIYSTQAPLSLATSLLLLNQSAIFYAAGWHTCIAVILWVSRSNVGWCSVILSHLISVSLVPSYEWTAIGNRCPENDSVVFGDTLTITHIKK